MVVQLLHNLGKCYKKSYIYSEPPQTIGEFWRRSPVAALTLGTLSAKSWYLVFGLRKSTISWPSVDKRRYLPIKERNVYK